MKQGWGSGWKNQEQGWQKSRGFFKAEEGLKFVIVLVI